MRWLAIPLAALAGIMLASAEQPSTRQPDVGTAAPEFTHAAKADWINSEPLSLQALHGSVVLIDFWTFDCWNCYRSFPWLNGLHDQFAGRGLQVIGVHSPEFQNERVPQSVASKVREFKLDHPVMIDNDFSYWNAIGNEYWPAFYLVDKRGRLRYRFAGETHAGDRRALEIEGRIDELLSE